MFFTDQQRHDPTSAHGPTLGLTPNFDRLTTQGTQVVNSFTCQPVCGPARSCLQTGMHASTTGGWHTGYIDEWPLAPGHVGPVPRELPDGYQSWLAANALEFTSDAYKTHVWDGGGREHTLPGYRVDPLTDAAIRHLDARSRSDQPFFLFTSSIEPHHENHRDDDPASEGYEECYVGTRLPPDLQARAGSDPQPWPGYCGMIKRLDEALGRLIDALRSVGQLDNPIILFTSDHRCHFKTRNDESKPSWHNASIRVPTALRAPGFDGGGALRQLVSLVDLPPHSPRCSRYPCAARDGGPLPPAPRAKTNPGMA